MESLWKLYDKQKEALKFVEDNEFSLLIGQSRASKTCFSVWYLFYRALKYQNTTHIMFRNTLTSAIDGLWAQTVKEVIAHFYPVLPAMAGFSINESSHTIKFHNGSRILLRGLDSPERATKVLSQQFDTLFLDELQTIDYCYLSLLLSRIPQKKDVDYKIKVIMTANYAPKTHWSYPFFVKKLNPSTGTPHNLNANYLKFTTDDNKSIDAEQYLKKMVDAGDRKSRLSYAGDDWFDEVTGALWKPDMILRAPVPEQLDKIIIAFDPAVTNSKTSDEHGICIAGSKFNKEKNHSEFFVLNCFEKKDDINSIAKEVISLYKHYNCSKLIYEENNGGAWIEKVLKNHSMDVYIEGVRAKVGKILRAEPCASLYANGLVYHCNRFQKLEDQMCCYDGNGDSPNCLDALVYAIGELNKKRVARGFT